MLLQLQLKYTVKAFRARSLGGAFVFFFGFLWFGFALNNITYIILPPLNSSTQLIVLTTNAMVCVRFFLFKINYFLNNTCMHGRVAQRVTRRSLSI